MNRLSVLDILNKVQLVLCPTALTCNGSYVPLRMSCSQLVLALCGRTTHSTRPNQSQSSIGFWSAGRNSRAVTVPHVWLFFFFFSSVFSMQGEADSGGGCGATRPRTLQSRWVHEDSHTHNCPLRLCRRIGAKTITLYHFEFQLKSIWSRSYFKLNFEMG